MPRTPGARAVHLASVQPLPADGLQRSALNADAAFADSAEMQVLQDSCADAGTVRTPQPAAAAAVESAPKTACRKCAPGARQVQPAVCTAETFGNCRNLRELQPHFRPTAAEGAGRRRKMVLLVQRGQVFRRVPVGRAAAGRVNEVGHGVKQGETG